MKLKLKLVHTPGSHRRLEVFRRICPDIPADTAAHLLPRDLLNEINSTETISPRPTVTTYGNMDRSSLVHQPARNGGNFSQGILGQYNAPVASSLNNGSNVETRNLYRDVNTELSEDIRQLQISAQNSNFGVTPPEVTWNNNYSDLMNITDYNNRLQNNRNGYVPQFLPYPRDLIDEIDYNTMLQSMIIENNQYHPMDTRMHFMPQPVPGPTDFLKYSFPLPYTEQNPMSTMNLSQPTVLDHIGFPNDRNTLDLMNYMNALPERRFTDNLFCPTLLDPKDYFDEILQPRPTSSVDLFQPTLMGDLNFINELSTPREMNHMSYSQPDPFSYMNFHNEFLQPTPHAMTSFQPTLIDYMNFSNGFSNYVLNNTNHMQWPMPQNQLQDYTFLPRETTLLHPTPRPILNRNCLGDLSLPTPIHDPDPSSLTEDYTTEYSLTHAIARPTPNEIHNSKFPVPCVPQNGITVEPTRFPLSHGSNGIAISHPPGIPRPILNRTYKNEFLKPYESQNPSDGFLKPYEPQNGLIDFANSTFGYTNNFYTNPPFLVPEARPILNRNDDFPRSFDGVSQNPELNQTNPVVTFTNPYEDFCPPHPPINSDNGISKVALAHAYMPDQINLQPNYMNPCPDFDQAQNIPRAYVNHINGFKVSSNIAQTSGMVYVNGTSEPLVPELPKLSQNVE